MVSFAFFCVQYARTRDSKLIRDASRIYKAECILYRSSDCADSPRVLLSTPNSRDSQLTRFVFDDEMQHADGERFFFFFHFPSPSLSPSPSLYLSLSLSLSRSLILLSFFIEHSGGSRARANTYVRRNRTIYRAHARTRSDVLLLPKIVRKYTQSDRGFDNEKDGLEGKQGGRSWKNKIVEKSEKSG